MWQIAQGGSPGWEVRGSGLGGPLREQPALLVDELAASDGGGPRDSFLAWLAVVISPGGGEIALLLPVKKWR